MRAGISRQGMWLALVVALVAALAAAPAGGQLPTSTNGCTKKPYRARGSVRATLHAPGHQPGNWKYIYDRDQKKKAWAALWPIRITASHAGHPISGGKVTYQFLFNGRIVACRPVAAPYSPHFRRGVMRDRIEWPERSIGIPLTFRAVVITRYGVKNLDYSVKVRPRRH
jgi:hypothetical protein